MNRHGRLISGILIGSMLLSACAGKEAAATSVPLTEGQITQLGLMYLALVPPKCQPNDLSVVHFSSNAASSVDSKDMVTVATTTFSPQGVDIGFSETDRLKDVDYVRSFLAHEIAHACPMAVEPGKIEPEQEIASKENVRVVRRIQDQYNQSPFIDLTFETTTLFGTKKKYMPLEEMFAYYFGQAIIENKFGPDSNELIFMQYYNAYPTITETFKNLFYLSGVSFEEISDMKSRADASGIIFHLSSGLDQIGIKYGIQIQVTNNQLSKNYDLLNFLLGSFRFDEINQDKAKVYEKMFDSLSNYYFGQSSLNITPDQRETINNIIEELLLGHTISSNLDLNHPKIVNNRVVFLKPKNEDIRIRSSALNDITINHIFSGLTGLKRQNSAFRVERLNHNRNFSHYS